jgi:hypothetical protein
MLENHTERKKLWENLPESHRHVHMTILSKSGFERTHAVVRAAVRVVVVVVVHHPTVAAAVQACRV